jgi:hypothetical protein
MKTKIIFASVRLGLFAASPTLEARLGGGGGGFGGREAGTSPKRMRFQRLSYS